MIIAILCSIGSFFGIYSSCVETENIIIKTPEEIIVKTQAQENLNQKIILKKEVNKTIVPKTLTGILINSGALLGTGNIDKPEIEKIIHIKTPEKVKSVYYTSYSAGSDTKMNTLYSLIKNTEINSVTIDIKTVSGYVSFKMDDKNFDKIKPISNNRTKNIKEVIKRLHEKGIYVIARVVVFKDKLLAERRPDLAVKRLDNLKVWTDYKGLKYLDPSSKEVWDYNANIAAEAYRIGFDEVNFDYVRFPTDGRISNTYYSFSNEIIVNNPKYGKIIALDRFSSYLTSKLKKEIPEIVLSADIFGLVTKNDLFNIGQSLESFVLYFDYVGPMVYPSHYGAGYLGYSVPDNHPYEIIKEAIYFSNTKIDKLNKDIKQATMSGSVFKLKNAFVPAADIKNIGEISKEKIRPWLQGFSCSWCKGATTYGRNKFREQIRALYDSGLDSWWVWSSSSNYYQSWYNKN